ncbi:hypothetical protein ACQKL5_17070 [Peribacillus sp. NPDC097675]|uniref:hypothetical protein n=1 Tax=Peribacillus sp. NPDC097675 TaxID=3390618 RepID=UPI003D01B18D
MPPIDNYPAKQDLPEIVRIWTYTKQKTTSPIEVVKVQTKHNKDDHAHSIL